MLTPQDVMLRAPEECEVSFPVTTRSHHLLSMMSQSRAGIVQAQKVETKKNEDEAARNIEQTPTSMFFAHNSMFRGAASSEVCFFERNSCGPRELRTP